MGDRVETVTYKMVLDTSGIPAELRPGPAGAFGPPGGGIGPPGSFGPQNLPQRGSGGQPPPDATPDVQQVRVRVMQRDMLEAAARFTKILNAGLAGGLRQVYGGSLGANPAGVLRGSVSLAGGAGQIAGAGVRGATGSALAGAAVGVGAVLAARALMGLVDTIERVSTTFGRYNGQIAASNASVQVAAVRANIQMANATAPLIESFNKLKVATLGLTAGVVSAASRFAGPAIGGAFDAVTQALARWAKKLGIDISPMTKSMISPALAVASGRLASTSEMTRSVVDVPGRPGLVGQQRRMITNILQQQQYLRTLDAQYLYSPEGGADGKHLYRDPFPSQTAFVQAAHRRYDAMLRRYESMRTNLSKRYGGQGRPVVVPIRPHHVMGDLPDPTLAERTQSTRDELSLRERQYAMTLIQLRQPDLAKNFSAYATTSVQSKGLAAYIYLLKQRLKNMMPKSPEEMIRLRVLDDIAHGDYGKNKKLTELSSTLMRATGERAFLEQQTKAMADRLPLNRPLTQQQRQDLTANLNEIKRLKAEEAKAQREYDAERRRMVDVIRKKPTPASDRMGPFAIMDFNTNISIKLEQKIASERQVNEALNQVREQMLAAVNDARNEARLSALMVFAPGSAGGVV